MLRRHVGLYAGLFLALPFVIGAQEGIFYPPQRARTPDLDRSPADELNRTVRVLRTTNKAQINRYVPKVYDFKNVNPFAVLRFMSRPVQAEEGIIFTFVHPDGDKGRALVAIPEYQVPHMDRLMQLIDRRELTSSSGSKRHYMQLKHRRAFVSDDPVLDDSAFLEQFDVYLTTNSGTIFIDPEQNAVYIEDAPSGADYLKAALEEKLDTPTPQVQFTIKVYEVDLSKNKRIGLDYIAWKNGPGADLLTFGAFGERGRTVLRNGSSSLLNPINGLAAIPRSPIEGSFDASGSNFSYQYVLHSAFFDFLSTTGSAKLLTSIKTAILNTRSAHVEAGDQILYYKVTSDDSTGGIRDPGDPKSANNDRTVTDEIYSQTVGLKFDIEPLIYENGVDVSISGSLSSLVGFDDMGQPRISSQEISTTIRMGEGDEMVLGGLVREEAVQSASKIPILGSIPFLGYAFGGDNTRRSKSEIVISISADKIVRFAGDAGISDEDRNTIRKAEGSMRVSSR